MLKFYYMYSDERSTATHHVVLTICAQSLADARRLYREKTGKRDGHRLSKVYRDMQTPSAPVYAAFYYNTFKRSKFELDI